MISRGLLTSVMAVAVMAAAAEEIPDTLGLDDVVVSAPVKTKIELTPLDVTVVGRKQIEESAETSLLPILMQNVAGLFVSERGFAGYGVSGGAAGAVNIRGVGGGNKVLFMIDGQPQWAGVFGHSLPDTYVANGVERVEVVKGPSSLLYGSGAMGGSVNLITHKVKQDGVYGRARAMMGSFTTEKFDMAAGVRKGKLAVNAAAQLDRSNGNRERSEFWLANQLMQLEYTPSEHWNTGASVDMTQTRANNPGTLQSPLESMWTRLIRGTASIFVKNNYDRVSGGMQAYINWGGNKVDDGHAPDAAPRDYIFRSTDYNMGFTLYETVNPWQGNDLSAGLDFQHWGGHTWNEMKADGSKQEGVRKCENEIAGYVMMQQSLMGRLLSINGGVRLQHGSAYGNIWVPQAGLIVRPMADSEFKFSFGKGFRSPNIRELYMYAPANPDLKPEHALNYEAAYRQGLLGGRLSLGVAFYLIDGKDMIQTMRVDGRPRNMNTGEFLNKGFELEGAWMIDRQWSAAANYAYLHTDNSILYAPKNKLGAQLNFNPGPLSFTLEDMSIWGLQNGNPDGSTADYTLLNLRASYTYRQGSVPVKLLVKLDNITNKHYEVIYGCPMPGTTIIGGIEVKF